MGVGVGGDALTGGVQQRRGFYEGVSGVVEGDEGTDPRLRRLLRT
jgi:hypothetical protein